MNFLGAFCSSMPADCSRNTNGPALPSMIGTSRRGQIDVDVVDAQPGERRHQVLDGGDRARRPSPGTTTGACRRPRTGSARISTGCGRSMRRNTMPVFGGGRPQRQVDLLAGVQTDAGGADHVLERALLDHGKTR